MPSVEQTEDALGHNNDSCYNMLGERPLLKYMLIKLRLAAKHIWPHLWLVRYKKKNRPKVRKAIAKQFRGIQMSVTVTIA